MRIRTLVPALACLAAAAPAFLAAADTAPVKLDGFVDTIWSAASQKQDGTSVTGYPQDGFTYFAKLGAELTISDKVGGQIDITNNNNSYSDNSVYLRQAYGTWKVTPEVTFKSGRFIDCVGWTSAYAPGLYRINAGPIIGLYGVDSPVGVDATYAKGDMTFEASIVNGFFGEGAGSTSQVSSDRHNAYAYMLDAAYTLPDKKGSVDAEIVYEDDASDSAGSTVAAKGFGGNGYHLGVNATLTPADPITVGLEAIYQKVSEPKDSGLSPIKNLGLMALGNYKIPNNAWGASVTGSLQYVKNTNVDYVDGANTKTTEVAVALLTTPAGTDKLGVNAEVGYKKIDMDSASSSTKEWDFALEALYIIP
jgi:hypothetical protein